MSLWAVWIGPGSQTAFIRLSTYASPRWDGRTDRPTDAGHLLKVSRGRIRLSTLGAENEVKGLIDGLFAPVDIQQPPGCARVLKEAREDGANVVA